MERNQYIVAIEIGSSKIVGAIAEKSISSGMVSVRHLVERKNPSGVRYGNVQNVETTRNTIHEILTDLESRVDGKVSSAYVGISGRSLHSQEIKVSRNLNPQSQITEKTIESIMTGNLNGSYGGLDIIDVVPRTFLVDNTETQNPSGRFGSKIDIVMSMILSRPTVKLNLDRTMTGVTKVKKYLVTHLVTADEVLTQDERQVGCMLVDLGAETADVSIYKNGVLQYLNTLPMGGRNVTIDVKNVFSITEEKAERVKKSILNPFDKVEPTIIEGVNSAEAAPVIANRLEEIVANINASLGYANMTSKDIRTVVVMGGASTTQDLLEKIRTQLRVDNVRMAHCPSRINVLNHSINRPEYFELFALLLRGGDEIAETDSCIEQRAAEQPAKQPGAEDEQGGGFTMTGAPAEAAGQPAPQSAPKSPKKKKSLWDRLGQIFTENDEDDQ